MEHYTKKELLLSKKNVFVITVISFIIITSFFLLIYRVINIEKVKFSTENDILFLIVLLFSFAFHEFIHYFTALLIIGKKKKHLLRISFSWKYFAPLFHCSKQLEINQYKLIAIMPFIVLSIIPFSFAILFQSFILFILSFVSTLGCAGDLYIYFKLNKYPNRTLVEDHPSKIGCVIYERSSETNYNATEESTI